MAISASTLKPWVVLNLILAILVILAFPVAAIGTRWGLWSYGSAFLALRVEFFLGIIVVLLSVILLVSQFISGNKLYLATVILSLVFALVAISPLIYQYIQVNKLPKIHDITTDVDNPPQFQAALAIRPAGSNSVVYQGAEIASEQQAAYPDIKPIFIELNPQQAFAIAEKVVRQLKWDITMVNENSGVIEASQTSSWFGFTDDVVIRVESQDQGGSRVDIRSVSRVGVSDIGANAARINKFITLFNQDSNKNS